MTQGGICLLAMTADDAEDPQTLRMVAGAIANLCGNGTPICSSNICLTFLITFSSKSNWCNVSENSLCWIICLKYFLAMKAKICIRNRKYNLL